VANQRRKTTIHNIDGPNGIGDTIADIIREATHYYKELFRYEERPSMSMAGGFFSEGEKLTQEENMILEAKFS
jgi:hypothetical protein